MAPSFKYSLVPGIFVQDDPHHEPTHDQIAPRFGLVGHTWPDVDALNSAAPEGTSYKLLFAGRHGQGFHNVGEAKYGKKAWDEYWSFKTGDGVLVWGPDPLLTDIGIQQARNVAQAWSNHTGPRPTAYYASPLRRALRTFQLTFAESVDEPRPVALAREGIREHMTGHTCDVRLRVSELKEFGEEFETDGKVFDWSELEGTGVDADPREKDTETDNDVKARAKLALDVLFATEEAKVVSITSHSGFIAGLSRALGRRALDVPTGGVAPFLIKAKRVS